MTLQAYTLYQITILFSLIIFACLPFYNSLFSVYRVNIFSNFMLTVTFDKGIGPKTSYIFILRGTGIVLVLFDIYPIVPYAPEFCTVLV